MKNLFDTATASEVKERVARLTSTSERQWGKMNPAQAISHCSRGMEWAVGDNVPDTAFFLQLIGRLVKKKALGNEEPMRKNSPTAKSLMVKEDRVLEPEKLRLTLLIDRFAAGGPAGCTKNSHTFFGPLTPEEWSILMYKHVDHHLRQFGV